MIWHAVVCDECSPCKLTHPYRSLRNTFKYPTDLVSQFGMADIVGINANHIEGRCPGPLFGQQVWTKTD